MGKVVAVDAVLAHETLENVETLGSENVNTTLLEEVRSRIRCVLDEAGIHKLLAHGLGHIACHGESRRGRGRYDTGGVSGIRPTVRLRELERCQVPRSVIAIHRDEGGSISEWT